MLRTWTNSAVKYYLKANYLRMSRYIRDPEKIQQKWFNQLLAKGRLTEFGKAWGLKNIKTYSQFSEAFPVQDYESLKTFIRRMMLGEQDVLWPGKITSYSKSSGTSNDQSKYIPVSSQGFRKGLIRGSWDSCSVHYNAHPDAKIFSSKSLVMGGCLDPFKENPKAWIGDVSALMIKNMPTIGRPFYTPDFEIALMEDWEEKIDQMARQVIHEDVYMFGGVPTWTIVLFNKMLELTGKQNILEIWPNVKLYMHGGVGFDPYKDQFKTYLPDPGFVYQEIYNASEGYFAVQNDYDDDDLLLLLDNGIFYEFMPRSEWHKEEPKAVSVGDVIVGETYSLIITTNSGLWRYQPGDTVEITSKVPLKIKVSGRVNQYINVFGEEVMIHNTDQALALTCNEMEVTAHEYTVAPVFINSEQRGAHEWIIEFETEPTNLEQFAICLDLNLQKLNSDYQAKRHKNMALENLQIESVPKDTFIRWMEKRGKLGGQHKVPRLSNERKYVNSIKSLVNNSWK